MSADVIMFLQIFLSFGYHNSLPFLH